MSVRSITQVFDKSIHAGTELLMLIVLADYSDDEGNSYPAVASLARKCRMKPRNANYILKSLQESGELRVLKNEGPKGTNRYRIMLSALGTKPLQPIAPLQRTAPLQHSAPTPATQCAKPLQPIADEPSLNRQEPSVQKISQPDGFDVFYKAYPKKVAKPDALRAFKAAKLKVGELALVLADIGCRKDSEDWQKERGKYIPNPATYLTRRRWEDETLDDIPVAKKPWDGAR